MTTRRTVFLLALILALTMSAPALAFSSADEYIDVSGQGLTRLDVSRCAALLGLNCDDNRLKSLDVSHNVKLLRLRCKGNGLESLVIGQNAAQPAHISGWRPAIRSVMCPPPEPPMMYTRFGSIFTRPFANSIASTMSCTAASPPHASGWSLRPLKFGPTNAQPVSAAHSRAGA